MEIQKDYPDWEDEVWEKHGKSFDTEYGYKKEIKSRSVFPSSILKLLEIIEDRKFLDKISEIFQIDELIVDKDLYGSGLNIYPPGSKLKVHTDFNFNSDLNLYRSINLLFYVSNDWNYKKGGYLELYDENLKNKVSIPPISNSCVVFAPNSRTFHGVSEIRENFYRKSLSIWFYTKLPQRDVNLKPHKTNWA